MRVLSGDGVDSAKPLHQRELSEPLMPGSESRLTTRASASSVQSESNNADKITLNNVINCLILILD